MRKEQTEGSVCHVIYFPLTQQGRATAVAAVSELHTLEVKREPVMSQSVGT